ncbi:alpha/beta hydrolase [Mucilaginibacter sp. L3T2-6]|uniref:alpha/beta hydrolase n=1 Tax=Mucilaginibacter sp. L3T2-6 TaxID=3062491 RepID=UPI002675D6BC|nr:alpha/beta hydrolase [Mucilaginibacter sp. L3T2-6]MDO3640846.1 alpha/beta hydrolase [Mucilaginibacter sp. L3T2-6]MDV6213678.1 alpha/beta hydrolase [Mucilaginibacter sp. L3T2-6]
MMIKKLLLTAGIFFITLSVKAQPVRYKNMVFEYIKTTIDLSYDAADPAGKNKARRFDLYQPAGDTALSRPLIIWMHGGGFKFGSKDDKSNQIWGRFFAQRGYVVATINYTLSRKLPFLHFDELKRSCYNGVLDAKRAIGFFKQHSHAYHIDPSKIILAGNSAGGMIALQAAFSTNAELARFAGVADEYPDDQQLLKVAGVINFWGAIFNLDWLKNCLQLPLVSVYGSTDSIVAPTHKGPPLYGAADIFKMATALGIPNDVKVFEGYSHELHKRFNPVFSGGKDTQARWLEAAQFAADFLYKQVIK